MFSIFSLLFSFNMAYAKDLSDLAYEAKILIEKNDCEKADTVTQEMLETYPQRPEGYYFRAKIGECFDAYPDRIYRYYIKYLALGGEKSKVSQSMARLDKKLSKISISMVYTASEASLKEQELVVVISPILIDERDDIEPVNLTKENGRWVAAGLPPGRYQLTIDSPSSFVGHYEQKFNLTRGKTTTHSAKLKTMYDQIGASLKSKDCQLAMLVYKQLTKTIHTDKPSQKSTDLMDKIHQCYIKKGAPIPELETFRTSILAAAEHGLRTKLSLLSVTLPTEGQFSLSKNGAPIEEISSFNGTLQFLLYKGSYQFEFNPSDPLFEALNKKIVVSQSKQEHTVPVPKEKDTNLLSLSSFSKEIQLKIEGDETSLSLNGSEDTRLIKVLPDNIQVTSFYQNEEIESIPVEFVDGVAEYVFPSIVAFTNDTGEVVSFRNSLNSFDEIIMLGVSSTTDLMQVSLIEYPQAGTVANVEINGLKPVELRREYLSALEEEKKGKKITIGASSLTAGLLVGSVVLNQIAGSHANQSNGALTQGDHDMLLASANQKMGLAFSGYALTLAGGALVYYSIRRNKGNTKSDSYEQYLESLKTPILIDQSYWVTDLME